MQNIEGKKSATLIILAIALTGILFFGGIYWNYSPF